MDEENKAPNEDYRALYDALKDEFEAYKAETAERARREAVAGAYRRLLEDSGIAGRRAEAVLRATDLGAMTLETDGRLAGEADLRRAIAETWGDLMPATYTRGAAVATPPARDEAADAFARGFDGP